MADITLTGNLGNDAELSFTPSGKAKLEFSVGDTPRRLNAQTNQWEDAGETTWWRVTEWGDKAEALVDPLRKGTKVLVAGTASIRKYEKKDGSMGFSAEVRPRTIAIVPKVQYSSSSNTGSFGGQQQSQPFGGSQQGFGQQNQQQGQPAQDPWGGQQTAGGFGGQPNPQDPPF